MTRHRKFLSALFIMAALALLPAQTFSQYESMLKEWNQPFRPFQIIGNIYYVGTNNLACYIIKTNAGLILLDTALQESAPIVRANIETLGFKLRDIKIMLSSHAHFDHVAGHAEMKAATGAKVYATKADAEIMESGGKKGFHPLQPYYKPVKVDKILEDKETIRLGEVTMTAHLVPGHTEGNTAWTMTVEENGRKYNVVFTGSMSINPGVRMLNNPTWAGVADAYAKSFAIMKSLPCDVFLGPHAPFFNMEEKVKRLGAQPNPFIDPNGLRNFLEMNEKNYQEQVQRESKAAMEKNPKIISIKNAEHYTWGDNCDGWHLVKSDALSIIQERMPPGTAEVKHFHERARQFFYVLSGEATLVINNERIVLHANEGLEVPPQTPHQMRNDSKTDVIFTVTSMPKSHGDRVEVK